MPDTRHRASGIGQQQDRAILTSAKDQLLELVEHIPAFPQAVMRILDITSRGDCDSKELVRIIERDPVLAMKILKLVNSPYVGLPQPIASVSHSVIFVGINTIKNLALSVAAIGMLPKTNAADFDMDQLLKHSLGVATVAARLAELLGVAEKDRSDYFLAGLLHDFGKVVLAQYKAVEFKQALEKSFADGSPLHQAETAILGYDHAYIGALLAEKWLLPARLVDCIGFHHAVDTETRDDQLRDCVALANIILQRLNFGFSGNRYRAEIPSTIEARFAMSGDDIISSLGDLDDELAKVTAFSH